MRIPQRSKSPVLRVATAARRERAMAAIMASNCEIRRPAASRPATIGGYDGRRLHRTGESGPRTLPQRSCRQRWRRERRLPRAGSRFIEQLCQCDWGLRPPMVPAAASQRKTRSEGEGRSASRVRGVEDDHRPSLGGLRTGWRVGIARSMPPSGTTWAGSSPPDWRPAQVLRRVQGFPWPPVPSIGHGSCPHAQPRLERVIQAPYRDAGHTSTIALRSLMASYCPPPGSAAVCSPASPSNDHRATSDERLRYSSHMQRNVPSASRPGLFGSD